MRERRQRVERALEESLEPVHLEIEDQSDRHAGHAGARSGGSHYRITIVSERFGGRSRLERHRMLYDALGSLMEVEIHALAIRAFTPTEWTEQRS
ncbi:MAG: BolA family transcriptional regulator [Myxococcales bacterium]|nr:BolA family transcriptional regulator [Myxococcales bacterium]